MRVKVTKSFKWAGPTGNHVRQIQPGEVLEGRGAEVALHLGCGVEFEPLRAKVDEEFEAKHPEPPETSEPVAQSPRPAPSTKRGRRKGR